MEKIYVIMFIQRIFEDTFYTDENKVAKRVEALNVAVNSNGYWYKTLSKA